MRVPETIQNRLTLDCVMHWASRRSEFAVRRKLPGMIYRYMGKFCRVHGNLCPQNKSGAGIVPTPLLSPFPEVYYLNNDKIAEGA